MIIISFLILAAFESAAALANVSLPTSAAENGIQWIKNNQNLDGSWGNTLPLRDTPTALITLSTTTTDSSLINRAKLWLSSTDSPNNDYLVNAGLKFPAIAG